MKKISFLLLIIALYNFSAISQIVFTDISDTTLIPDSEYEFDMNNDGVLDFKFECWHPTWFLEATTVNIYSYDNNQVAQTPPPFNGFYEYVQMFLENDTVLDTLHWYSLNYGNYLFTTEFVSEWSGFFNDQQDVYIGLKLLINSNIHYGWAKVDVGFLGSYCTIKSFAYNSIPNEFIVTNALPNSINNSNNTNLSLFPNPCRDYLTVNGDYQNIEIFNSFGRKLIEFEYNEPMNLSFIQSGILLFKVNTKGGSVSKIIIKE